MKSRFLSLLIGGICLVAVLTWSAEEKKDAKTQLQQLVAEVTTKLRDGKRTEKDLAPELKKFDELLAEHKGEKTDAVAEIQLMKAMLYVQVFEEYDKGSALLKELKEKYPDSTHAKNVDEILAGVAQQAEGQKVRGQLQIGAAFPDFEAKNLEGQPVSVGKYKGKPVLVDFWATWCGPCVRELPHVQAAYKKYHDQGFEIIGISLDRSEETLREFVKNKEMTWPQVFDQGGEVAGKYGVVSIPTTYLIDGQGKIVAQNLRGDDLETELAKLLKK